MIWSLLLLFAAYLLGAIPFGYLLGRLVRGIDIRQHGSGNIGATNVGRVLGWKWFPLVLLLDFAKGAVPVALLKWHLLPLPPGSLGTPEELAAAAGLAAILGHLFPIYLGFRGGKGVATAAGALLVLLPLPALVAFGVFIVVVLASRYVSLSSLAAAMALVVARFTETSTDAFGPDHWAGTSVAVLAAVLVVVRHRTNISRLLAGTEPKVGRSRGSPPSAIAK